MQPSNADLLDIYETMLLIRTTELKMVELFKKGEIEGHMLPCLGQEAIPAALSKVYTDEDYLVTGHRGGGHYVARGCSYNALWAELYGRVDGVTKGRGGQIHLMDMSRKAMTGNAVVGQQWGIATGAGFVARNRGVAVFAVGGEGSTNRGVFHESLNMASVQKLPILYVIENNNRQMWNENTETTAGDRIAARASAYGMEGASVDGNDVLAVHAKASEFMEKIRAGSGPCLLECNTAKWTDSVSNLRNLPENVEAMKKPGVDPILRFEAKLLQEGLITESGNQRIKDAVAQKLQSALRFALASAVPDRYDGIDEVYSQPV
jgi:acetoin:2,6-dichlorophenolindophenol oxidoreductase subunit alpha